MTGNQTAQPQLPIAPLEYDSASGTYRTWFEASEGSSPSMALVAAIAAIEARDPCDLSATLHDCIDPDALDTLFHSHVDGTSRPDGRVEFTFDTYDVDMHADGRIVIHPRQP